MSDTKPPTNGYEGRDDAGLSRKKMGDRPLGVALGCEEGEPTSLLAVRSMDLRRNQSCCWLQVSVGDDLCELHERSRQERIAKQSPETIARLNELLRKAS